MSITSIMLNGAILLSNQKDEQLETYMLVRFLWLILRPAMRDIYVHVQHYRLIPGQ